MNSKFYLAAAALTMSLAACTSEEDLLSQGNQNGTSPVVFTLEANDEAMSRNVWANDAVTVQWSENTLLSLFHGDLKQNAIYKANAGSSDSKLSFSTQSMVTEGQAIMVHPADTTFENTGGNLYVKTMTEVPSAAEFDEILYRMPYISEGINIAGHNPTKNEGAGYGKQYNIKLRQIGSYLRLRFNWLGDEKIEDLVEKKTITEGIEIGKVTLNRPTDLFNTKLAVTLDVPATGVGENWDEVDETGTWDKASNVDIATPALQSTTLASLNCVQVKENDDNVSEVRFMLLPQQHKDEVKNTSLKTIDFGANAATDASIVVETNYGTLTLNDASGDKVFPGAVRTAENQNPSDNYFYGKDGYQIRPDMKVSAALNYFIALTNQSQHKATSTFHNEMVGRAISQYVKADLANLDMSTVHIEDEEHLLNVFYVHKALQPTTDVTFYIDGDANHEFVMSASTVALLNDWNANNEGKITLRRCTLGSEKCDALRLTGGGEVPQFSFIVGAYTDVILADGKTWTWTGGEKTYKSVRSFTNEGGLKLMNNAEVKFNHNYGGTFVFNNSEAARIVVANDAKLSVNTINNGTITIKEGISFKNNDIFTNEATSLEAFGKIYNYGTFANINSGEINNYGYIEQMTANSKTFITSNQTASVAFNAIWDATTNKFGTIKLFDKDDDNYSVYNSANQGFIMIETDAATVTAEEIGTQANYVKISGDCTKLDFTRTDTENERVLFIEIASSKEVEWTTENSVIRGLIVNEGCKLYIKKNNRVVVSQGTFLKGTIAKGGDFTPGSFVTYFGGEATDSENVLKWQ